MTKATANDISHLYARAAFGATKTDLTLWTDQEYSTVVTALFSPPQLETIDDTTLLGRPPKNKNVTLTSYPYVYVPEIPVLPDDARREQLSLANDDIKAAQRWWLNRMVTTPWPLLERMTLFWHTHFATAFAQPPDAGDLMVQNQTLRRNALGDLRQMLYDITVDPAMLHWLSGAVNRRGGVNENYARELFELFTMGTRPQTYTETDIRQAAKALTGWYIKSRDAAFDGDGRHDRTVKTIFGTQIGGYPAATAVQETRELTEYREVVDLALKQPTTAKFIAYKMVASFAYVPKTTNLLTNPDPLVDAVAATLRPELPDGKWDIAAAMNVLLNHPDFRYPDVAAGERIVRSPIEITAHLAKVTGINCDPPGSIDTTDTSKTGQAQYNQPILALQRLGQVPFQPPNVGGWPLGTNWLSTITTRARYDLVNFVLTRYKAESGQNTHPFPASTDIPGWLAFLGLGSIGSVTQSRLNAYLANPGTSDEATKQTSILFLLVSSPDWQVI